MTESPAFRLHKLVSALDRAADKIMQDHFDISYKRIVFLNVLQYHGPMSQHELALGLGYSDPAVSLMLTELAKLSLVEVTQNPTHGRKRIAQITPKGDEIVMQVRKVLDGEFEKLLLHAGVDSRQYAQETEQIYQALIAKRSSQNV
jgi:DNA-binding MarR family transcriptional regulator